jgi:hypothetical protein
MALASTEKKLVLKNWLSSRVSTRYLAMLACIVLEGSTIAVRSEDNCSADPKWLTGVAPLPVFAEPAPKRHDENGGDCPFYRAAWQVFLYATQPVTSPDGKTSPLFLVRDFSTIEETFGNKFTRNLAPESEKSGNALSLAPKSLQRPNSPDPKTKFPRIGAGVTQAVTLAPVIDKNGNPLFYAIHMNDVIKDFFTDKHLLTPVDLKKAEEDLRFQNLEFPVGSIELKSAWQIVDSSSPPPDSFFVTEAVVPWLKTDNNGRLVEDPSKKDPRRVTVALLGLHVVFVLQGHREFIWSTFEHVDSHQNPDVAPSAAHNPTKPPSAVGLITTIPPVTDYLLFKAGSPLADANRVAEKAAIVANFDEKTQTFTKTGHVFQTSVYRVYRASKANEKEEIDGDISAINDSMTNDVFKTGSIDTALDKRDHYRLVGAVWMDDPEGKHDKKNQFRPNMFIRNKPGDDPDKPGTKVAGEDRLSSTAMESFTQFEAALNPRAHTGNPNCFSCHDSHAITKDADSSITLLRASKLNVSHILSRYLLDAPSPLSP